MKQVINEELIVNKPSRIDDLRVTYELSYNEGNRILYSHILWSAIVFLVALLI